MLFVLNSDKLQLLKVVATEEQAFYWADILCKKQGYHVNDFSFDGLEIFSLTELARMFENFHGNPPPENWERFTLLGGILNLENQLLDETDCENLHKRLRREPKSPAMPKYLLPPALKVGAAVQTPWGNPKPAKVATVQGYPKEGTTSHAVWSACDLLYRDRGCVPTSKDMVEYLSDTGFNSSTIRTQFGHWKRFNTH